MVTVSPPVTDYKPTLTGSSAVPGAVMFMFPVKLWQILLQPAALDSALLVHLQQLGEPRK